MSQVKNSVSGLFEVWEVWVYEDKPGCTKSKVATAHTLAEAQQVKDTFGNSYRGAAGCYYEIRIPANYAKRMAKLFAIKLAKANAEADMTIPF